MTQMSTLSHTYHFDESTKVGNTMEGYIRLGEEKIPVFVIEECSPNLAGCIDVTHKNQVLYVYYDTEHKRMLCIPWSPILKESVTLKQYFAGINQQIGSFSPSISYFTPKVRQVFRDIITYVVDMHKKGYRLDKFTLENMIVEIGTVKFFGVGLHRSTKNSDRVNNLLNARSVLLELIPEGESNPLDYTDFLKRFDLPLLGNFEVEGILHHFCLMPPESVSRFIEKVGATIRDERMSIDLASAIKKMGDCTRWHRKLDVCGFEDLRTCLHSSEGNGNYILEGKTYSVNKSLLTCCKNLMTYAKVSTESNEDPIIKCQVLVLNAFMKELCCLQKALSDRDNLGRWFDRCSEDVSAVVAESAPGQFNFGPSRLTSDMITPDVPLADGLGYI